MVNWREIEKNVKFLLNNMESCYQGLKYALSGRMEIHPCVLQDIGPLGPLPCSYSTSSVNHSKQGIGYRWPCAILGWLVSISFSLPSLSLPQTFRMWHLPLIIYTDSLNHLHTSRTAISLMGGYGCCRSTGKASSNWSSFSRLMFSLRHVLAWKMQ